MTPRAAIQQIARMVRDDIRAGELSPGTHSVGDMLAAQPEALQLIVDLAGAEGRKKLPDAGMHHAYSSMLGQTLEQLRQRSEAGNGHATMAMENVGAVRSTRSSEPRELSRLCQRSVLQFRSGNF